MNCCKLTVVWLEVLYFCWFFVQQIRICHIQAQRDGKDNREGYSAGLWDLWQARHGKLWKDNSHQSDAKSPKITAETYQIWLYFFFYLCIHNPVVNWRKGLVSLCPRMMLCGRHLTAWSVVLLPINLFNPLTSSRLQIQKVHTCSQDLG